MIELIGLTKRYRSVLAVDDLTFTVAPGRVTGFLGPNGSGKSTTMRAILGLDQPTNGRALVNGVPYRHLQNPLRVVGSLLDAAAVHPGRRAVHHLLAIAQSNGIPTHRVNEQLDLVGLGSVAGRRVGGYSLGMRQRLGIAAALLGDPPIVMLDEPINGLDTEGIRWIRELLRRLAAEGRTVFVSSHVMSEMELTADHLVVIGRGRLIADASMDEFIARHSRPVTVVRSEADPALLDGLAAAGATIAGNADAGWQVSGPDAAAIGAVAKRLGVALHELRPLRSTLEEIFTVLTAGSTAFVGSAQS